MDLIQFDNVRRVLCSCADDDSAVLEAIAHLTYYVYEQIASGQKARLEISAAGCDQDCCVCLSVE